MAHIAKWVVAHFKVSVQTATFSAGWNCYSEIIRRVAGDANSQG